MPPEFRLSESSSRFSSCRFGNLETIIFHVTSVSYFLTRHFWEASFMKGERGRFVFGSEIVSYGWRDCGARLLHICFVVSMLKLFFMCLLFFFFDYGIMITNREFRGIQYAVKLKINGTSYKADRLRRFGASPFRRFAVSPLRPVGPRVRVWAFHFGGKHFYSKLPSVPLLSVTNVSKEIPWNCSVG